MISRPSDERAEEIHARMPTGVVTNDKSRCAHARRQICLMLVLVALGLGCSAEHDTRLTEIRTQHAAGALDRVVASLQEILAEDPDHAEANFMLGQVLLQIARPELAIPALEKAAQSKRFARPAGLLLASTHFEMHAFEDAVAAATRVLEVDSSSQFALLTRGRSQLAAGHPTLALADADRILETEPNDQNASLLRARTLLDLGRAEEAEKIWIDMHTRLRSLGIVDQAARACTQLSLFYLSQQEVEKTDRTYQDCLEKYPTDAYLQRWASDFYVRRGEVDRVIELHRTAVETVPDDLRLWARLANMLLATADGDEAEATLREATARFDSPQSWRLLADLYLKRGDSTQAREALESAIEKSPEPHQPSLYSLADLLVQEGDIEHAREIGARLTEPTYQHMLEGNIKLHSQQPQLALEHFDAALSIWPQNSRARFLAGEAALLSGNRPRAISEYATALSIDDRETDAALRLAEINFASRRPRQALSFAQRHISRRPYTDSAPYRIAVRSAIALGDYVAAERFAGALELLDPDDVGWVIEKATIQRHGTGPMASSEFILSSGRDLADPANHLLLRGLVNDLAALGRATQGLVFVDAAIEREPNRAALHDLRARMFFELEKFEETSIVAEHALALDPAYAPAFEVRAFLALERGDSKAALAALDDAAKAAPESADYSYSAAAIARKMGDDNLAIAYLEEALARQPGFALAANDLASLLANTGGDLDRALALTRVALTRSNNATVLDTLGWVRHQRGEYDYAVSSFRSALERNPDSPAIEYRLGMSLLALGEIGEARKVFEKLLDSPAPAERDLARAELARLDDS